MRRLILFGSDKLVYSLEYKTDENVGELVALNLVAALIIAVVVQGKFDR